jgi:cytoskeletal protein CcmA (bactofilin family)
MGASTWTVSGNWNTQGISNNVFNANNSTLIMDGASKTLDHKTASILQLNTVKIPGNIVGASGDSTQLIVQGTFTVTYHRTVDLKVTSTGLVDGAGSLTIGKAGTGVSQLDGVLSVNQLIFTGSVATISSGTYHSASVLFQRNTGLSNYDVNFNSGVTTFNGDVIIENDNSANYTIKNTNNPTLVFRKNLTLREIAGPITWTKGSGTIAFSSNSASQQASFLGKSIENIVSSNTSSGGLTFVSSFTTPSLYVNAGTLGSAATIYFAGHSTFTISTFTASGSATYPVVLKSTDSTQWFLNATSSQTVSYVQVSSSNANPGLTIFDRPGGVDNGNNNNWVFPGTSGTLTWTGAIDNNWNIAGNWSGNTVPTSLDNVVIPNTTNKAQLQSAAAIRSLDISQGDARLELNNYNLTVSTYVNLVGTITASGIERIYVGGNWTNSGWYSPAAGTVDFNGASGYQYIVSGGTGSGKAFTNVYFTGTSTLTVSTNDLLVLGNLIFQSGASTFNNAISSKNISVAGNVTMNNTRTDMGGSTWTVSGHWDSSTVPLFNRNTSLLDLTGNPSSLSASFSLQSGLEDVFVRNNVILGSSITVNGNLVVIGTLTVPSNMLGRVISDGSSNLKIPSTGRITGPGQFWLGGNVPLTVFDGHIDVDTFVMSDNHVGNVVPGIFESRLTRMTLTSVGDSGMTFQGGTYEFMGDVTFESDQVNVFTVGNNVNNPRLVFHGDVDVQQTPGAIVWNKGSGEIVFSSNNAQTANFLGKSMERLVSSNTASTGLTFVSSFTTPSLFVNSAGLSSAATVYFAGHSTFSISTFTVNGSASYPVVLRSTSTGMHWFLNNTSSQSVSYVDVSYSSASAGMQILDYPGGRNSGNNHNWIFTTTPTLVSPTFLEVNQSSITVQWGSVIGASYELQTTEVVGVITTSSFTALTQGTTVQLTPNTTYSFRVASLQQQTTSPFLVLTLTSQDPPVLSPSKAVMQEGI